MAKATVNGLRRLRRPEDVARMRGLSVSQVLPYKAPELRDEEPPTPQEIEDGEGPDNAGS
jgi:hypothetical protein